MKSRVPLFWYIFYRVFYGLTSWTQSKNTINTATSRGMTMAVNYMRKYGRMAIKGHGSTNSSVPDSMVVACSATEPSFPRQIPPQCN